MNQRVQDPTLAAENPGSLINEESECGRLRATRPSALPYLERQAENAALTF
jgi:hypothetical protein